MSTDATPTKGEIGVGDANTTDVRLTAERYAKSGLSVIPIKPDGSKSPAVAWKPFQTRIADPAELNAWFRNGNGIGIVAGKVSGSLEILDFDNSEIFDHWRNLLEQTGPGLLARFLIVMTPKGFHVFYRCPDGVEGNQKLAQKKEQDGELKTIIETRGEGGYVVVPGSPPECHPSGIPYVMLQGDLTEIPTITAEERQMLIECARAINEVPKRTITGVETQDSNKGQRPGDEFNAKASWDDILVPHDWNIVGQRGDVTDWQRPVLSATSFGPLRNFILAHPR